MEKIKDFLAHHLGFEFTLRFHKNRHRLATLKRCDLALHRMFLNASQEILLALVRFLKLKDSTARRQILSYAKSAERALPLSLATKGAVYDLEELYLENMAYFANDLELKIIWWSFRRRSKRRIVFGTYDENCLLIRINQVLDSPDIPRYFVSFVVYHEMLHHNCPPYFDAKGVCRRHGPEFKILERRCPHYAASKQWLAASKTRFF